MHGVQKCEKGNLISFAEEEEGNLRKERMGCRQRGQGIEPDGVEDSEGILVVEQR